MRARCAKSGPRVQTVRCLLQRLRRLTVGTQHQAQRNYGTHCPHPPVMWTHSERTDHGKALAVFSRQECKVFVCRGLLRVKSDGSRATLAARRCDCFCTVCYFSAGRSKGVVRIVQCSQPGGLRTSGSTIKGHTITTHNQRWATLASGAWL